jgi:hypothetical protein
MEQRNTNDTPNDTVRVPPLLRVNDKEHIATRIYVESPLGVVNEIVPITVD